ncbi:MAG: hypothetical protein EAZ32_16075 [Cytophagia bacterium]|nr:MAG: hypothetical protein EAZ38_03725 [Cytophagales bacterium]TAG37171.1 MAG: hypothetical protein EAZ32_16075 [Cytophagia bacterium]TAG84068.1 MAG: hypothetical protein EAZ22_01145 [Cytophagales bacterium]
MKEFKTIMVRDITPEMNKTMNDVMSRHNLKTAQSVFERMLKEYPVLTQRNAILNLKLNNLQVEFEDYQSEKEKEIQRLNHIINHVKESINLLNNISK